MAERMRFVTDWERDQYSMVELVRRRRGTTTSDSVDYTRVARPAQ